MFGGVFNQQTRLQMSATFRSSATGTDVSDRTPMSGILKKKNRGGIWQKRYFALNNDYLVYKKDSNAGTIKGAFDLQEVESVAVIERGSGDEATVIEICLNGGSFPLKCSSSIEADKWVETIKERIEWSKLKAQEEQTLLAAGPSIHIEGWLMKKSHNKLTSKMGLQERYIRVQGDCMRYYKRQDDEQEQGMINLESADSIRPYDNSPDCLTFEVKAASRVFSFDCESPGEMRKWVKVLNQVREDAKKALDEMNAAKLTEKTPIWIRVYDEQGAAELQNSIAQHLEKLYDDEEELTLKQQLNAAKAIDSFVEELVLQTNQSDARPARLDVLAVSLQTINQHLSERMEDVVKPDDEMQLGDIHAIIDWLSTHSSLMQRTYCPSTDEAPSPLVCSLLEHTTELCELYVNGSDGQSGAASHLKDHCVKVWERFTNDPKEMVQQHQDGTFYTHVPTDTWEALNQHLKLATSTNSPALHVLIADRLVDALIHQTKMITQYVKDVDTTHVPELKEIELEMFSAIVNDAGLHIENVDNVIENFELEEVQEKIDRMFDSVTAALIECGKECLNRLTGMVIGDLEATVSEIFTQEWLSPDGSQMKIIIATTSDYIQDFQTLLSNFWFEKLRITMVEAIIKTYVKTILFRVDPNDRRKLSSKIFNMAKGNKAAKEIRVSEDALNKIQGDAVLLKGFLIQTLGSDEEEGLIKDLVSIITDMIDFMAAPTDQLMTHTISKMESIPQSAPSIKDFLNAVMSLRDDCDKNFVEEMGRTLASTIRKCATMANDMDEDDVNIRLIELYTSVTSGRKEGTTPGWFMGSVQKAAAVVRQSLSSPQSSLLQDSLKFSEERSSILDDALHVLDDHQDEMKKQIAQEAENLLVQKKEEEERVRQMMSVEGKMEKKSHNVWQKRFFKLSTRYEDKTPVYNLVWYKKKGDTAANSIECSSIITMTLRESSRPLSFMTKKGTLLMSHEIDEDSHEDYVEVKQSKENSSNLRLGALMHGNIPGDEHFGFSLYTTKSEEKGDILLRVSKIDEMIKWMNALAEAAQLDYDPVLGLWNHAANMKRKERMKEEEEMERRRQLQEEEAKKKRQEDIQTKMKEQSEEIKRQQEEEEAARRRIKEDEDRKKKMRELEEERLRQEKREKMQRVAARKMAAVNELDEDKVPPSALTKEVDMNSDAGSENSNASSSIQATTKQSGDKSAPVAHSETPSQTNPKAMRRRSSSANGSSIKDNSQGEKVILSPVAKARMAAKAKRRSTSEFSSAEGSTEALGPAKMLLVGDSGVGKSCILLRYADDDFISSFVTTIGIDFKMKTLNVRGKCVKLQIWDTAGQERFRTITASYYRDALGIMLVYDVCSEASFNNTRNWMRQIEQNCTREIDMILVGNKCDVDEHDDEKRQVTTEQGVELAAEFGIPFYETSAKKNINVDECFRRMAEDILDRGLLESVDAEKKNENKIQVGKTQEGQIGDKKCCGT